ncbi:MAG: GNAT family N-acetyltransferase, partial [Agathobacter sp.]|nr:GNAT family N-acetyltransferase [Agathobacter sp.]
MRIITYTPAFGELPILRELWKEAFGDSDEFINMFYTTAFSPDRVFAVGEEEGDSLRLCGGLYWFDESFVNASGETERIAYVYAVAVSKEKRGLGYGKLLMEGVHAYLKGRGYYGVLLAPAEEGLFEFYEKLG